MKSAAFFRVLFVVSVASTVATGGCFLFDGLFPKTSGGGSGGSSGGNSGGGGLVRHGAPGPVNKDTQMASIKELIKATKDSIRANSSNLSKSAESGLQSGTAKYVVSSILQAMGLSTVQEGQGVKLTYDDQTRQITRIEGPQFAVDLVIEGGGATDRGVRLDLRPLNDGTFGSARLAIGAERWMDDSGFSSCGLPFGPICFSGTDLGGARKAGGCVPGSTPPPTPMPPPTAAPKPYEVFYNQFPEFAFLNRAEGSFAISPQGDTAKQLELTAGLRDFKKPQGLLFHAALPSTVKCSYTPGQWDPQTCSYKPGTTNCTTPDPSYLPRIPHRLTAKGRLALFEFDLACTYAADGDTAGVFTLDGDFNIKGESGWQSWSMINKIDVPGADKAALSTLSFEWTNHTYQVKFSGTAKPIPSSGSISSFSGVTVTGKFRSAAPDGATLATLSYDSTAGKNPRILLENGEEIDLHPALFAPTMPGGGSLWSEPEAAVIRVKPRSATPTPGVASHTPTPAPADSPTPAATGSPTPTPGATPTPVYVETLPPPTPAPYAAYSIEVAVTPSTATLYLPAAGGEYPGSVQLSAQVLLSNASRTSQVTWSSAAAEVAKVNSAGVVTAVKEGTATIWATSLDGYSAGSCEVTVRNGVALTGTSSL